MLLGTCYVPPNSSNDVWVDLETSLELASSDNRIDHIILNGDFNDNQFDPRNTKVKSLLSQFSLSQMIDEPTHFTENSSSCIDLIMTNNVNSLLYTSVGPPLLNQTRFHCPVIGVLNAPKSRQKSLKRKIWLYDRGDYDAFNNILTETNWDLLFHSEDINVITEKVTGCILQAAEKTIPSRIVTIRKGGPRWLSTHIRREIRKKNRIHKKAKRYNNPSDWSKFRKIRNKVTDLVRTAKDDYNNTLIKKLVNENSSGSNWWNIAKQITGFKGEESNIPPLLINDSIIFDETDKATEFNRFFVTQSAIDDSNRRLPHSNFNPIPIAEHIDNIILQESEVEDILITLNPSKASGPDLINPRLLKSSATIIKYPLCKLFNLSLEKAIYPIQWKKANVTPVYKCDKPNDIKNYRPISLLSVISKVMERCIYKHVHNHLLRHKIITSNQSGFTKGDSAVNQLVNITNEFGKALDNGKEIRVVFCDISKAFDRVWHKGLLFKLKKAGISGNLLDWFKNYLDGRHQRVVINGCASEWLPITAGVPQGSILGPLLFILFINDIVSDIEAEIKLFADDTSLFIVVDNPRNAADILNADLDRIHKWSEQWLVKFNPKKTETLIMSRKNTKIDHPPLYMNNQTLQNVTKHKHLGLIISNNGFWDEHIDYIIKKAYNRLNILRKCRTVLDRFTLEKLYFSFIRPILEYADVVWDTQKQTLINKLENVQQEAARIVTGGTKLTSLAKLYEETRWETLSERRKNHKLILFYKMLNNKTPEYLSSLVPNKVAQRHDHNTRQINNIQNVFTRTNLYSDYFLPSTIKLWNNLNPTSRNCESLNIFKEKIKSQNEKVPVHYYVGTRLGQILHTRLRMNCSSLKSHLFFRNLIDSPLCSCGEIETTAHYFFHCPLYNQIRREILSSLNEIPKEITSNLLLFGSSDLSDDLNIRIVKTTQLYIIKSKRFSN